MHGPDIYIRFTQILWAGSGGLTSAAEGKNVGVGLFMYRLTLHQGSSCLWAVNLKLVDNQNGTGAQNWDYDEFERKPEANEDATSSNGFGGSMKSDLSD